MPPNTDFIANNQQPNYYSESPIEDTTTPSTHTINIPKLKTFKNINELIDNFPSIPKDITDPPTNNDNSNIYDNNIKKNNYYFKTNYRNNNCYDPTFKSNINENNNNNYYPLNRNRNNIDSIYYVCNNIRKHQRSINYMN